MVLSNWRDILYPEEKVGWLTLNHFPRKDTIWFPIDQAPTLKNLRQNCFMCVGVRANNLGSGSRGSEEDVIAIPGLWIDLDFESETGAHKGKALPPDLDTCSRLLEESPYQPTLVVHSGHGLQAYWLFNDPWYFSGPEERTDAKHLTEGWNRWFQKEAAKHGWNVDGTADLSRVLRIPGTYNCKTKNQILVKIIQHSKKRYEPSDFDDFVIVQDKVSRDTIQDSTHLEHSGNVLQDKNLGERIRYLILHGDTLSKYKSRSEAVFAVINALSKSGYQDQDTISILMDPQYAISELPIEKGEKWVWKELERAKKKVQINKNDHGNPSIVIDEMADSMISMDLQTTEKGGIKETFYNMSMILQHDSQWSRKLRFDSFLNMSMLEGEPVSEVTEMRIAEWMGQKYGFGGNNSKVLTRAIHAASSVDTYDSLQEWIYALPKWDGTERLHSWIIECCGAPDTPLNGWIGYVAIMQMVARALNPGCIARLVPILEGPENKGKTRCIKLLGHPWSMTFDMSMDSKEAHMAVQGCWVAELAELDTLRKTTETRLKSFVSQQNDDYVPKYSNYRISHPRRCVFFGTTNESNYLPGQTGNTRWLPVKTEWFDLEKIEKDREQMFAESLAIFKATPDIQWWEELDSLRDDLKKERDDRRMFNVYEEDLLDWLNGVIIDSPVRKPATTRYGEQNGSYQEDPNRGVKYRNYVTWTDLARDYFKFESREKWSSWVIQRQVGEALAALGWIRGQRPRSEKRQKCWNRPGWDGNEDDDTSDEDVPF